MIYAELAGGLGNQMFIYAFARALGLRCGEPVTLLDRQDWRDGAPAHTVCALDALNISPDVKIIADAGFAKAHLPRRNAAKALMIKYEQRRGLMARDWHSFEAAAALEFPTDLYETSTVMWEVLAEGQIGPHGGLNFDAKPRRTSFAAEDLFRSHIAGMDAFAAGLLVAAKMHEDKVIENLQAERYSSFDSGIGATVENGTASLASLEEYALDIPQSKLIEATKSDHLESVKATINNYMIDALAEA